MTVTPIHDLNTFQPSLTVKKRLLVQFVQLCMKLNSSSKRALAGPLRSGSSSYANAQTSMPVKVLYYGPRAAAQAQLSLQVHYTLVYCAFSTMLHQLPAYSMCFHSWCQYKISWIA
jgi:hypothetical protein